MMKLIIYSIFMCIFLAASVSDTLIIAYPSYFPIPHYDFDKNELSKAGGLLGRALFYDPILSLDNTISCASCHSPYNAFAHTDHDLSHGIDDKIGTRNAPALFNLAWQKNFMWDGAINHLDMQALAPIEHEKEMGETLVNVIEKLQSESLYQGLFQDVYQDSIVTGERILKALSQFQLTLVSANAKYDQVQEGTEVFTAQEKKGYALFQTNCNSCHQEPLFSSYDMRSNGLPIDSTLMDYGKWKVSQLEADRMLFKVPSLRNLKFTKPYMHDGRFDNLYQVINHYTDGITDNTQVSPELRTAINLTENDKVDLVSFLLTLNDIEFVFNKEHHYPRELLNN